MPRTYKSEALAAVHEMIEGLHEGGAIDKRTLREFDEACLVPAAVLQPEAASVCTLSQCVEEPRFRLGTREEAAWRPSIATAVHCSTKRVGGHCLVSFVGLRSWTIRKVSFQDRKLG